MPATSTDINIDDTQRYLAALRQLQAGITLTATIPEIGNMLSGNFLLLREIRDLGEGVLLKDPTNNPIRVLIELTPDGPTGYYKPLSLHTFSGTIPEIEQELKNEILDLWDWLKEADDSELGQEPLEWKYHLQDIISA